jgi:hypothetical protein
MIVLALLHNYNQLRQLTINDRLRLAPFLTGPWMSTATNDERRTTNDERRISAHTKNSLISLSLMLRQTISRPVCLGIKHPAGAYDQICITVRLLRVCWCGALSLTRGQVCRLQLLLALASAFILGSESRGTRDHILLSQIRDFPDDPPSRMNYWTQNFWAGRI